MERSNRPQGRKKNVEEGSAHVGRREDAGAVGGGPLGSEGSKPGQSGQSGRPGGQGAKGPGVDEIGSLLGGLLGGQGASSSSSHSSSSSGSSKKGLSLGSIVILLVLGFLAFKFFGGDMGGQVAENVANLSPAVSTSQGGTSSASSSSQSSGSVNTAVSNKARDKRVALKGNGRDVTTILVYMCGTDLESSGGFATKDLQEMAAAELSDNVRLLVFTGGCKSWRNNLVSTKVNQIYRVQDGGFAKQWEGSSLQPMTDPATLSGFIQWGVKNYPADRYELIFWDHGGGSLSGYGYDEMYPRSGSMTLSGIAKALKDGGCTFDFIGFDACLMATLETALVAEPYADYLIGSEETEPGCGWYYTDWLNALSKNPSMSALEMGRNIADSFVSVCAQQAPGQQATLSVMDLAELAGTLPESFRSFAQATTQSIRDNDYQSIASARGSAKEFARSNNIDQIDLIDLADRLGTKEAKDLSKTLRSVVKYNATSRNIQNANGVSIYFPYGRTSNVNTASKLYDQIGLDSAYTDCIKSFASLEVAGQAASGGSSAQMGSLFDLLLGGGGGYSAPSSSSGDLIGGLLGSLFSGRDLGNVGLTQEEAGFLDEELMTSSVSYLADTQLSPAALTWTRKGGQKVLALSEDEWDLVQRIELNVFVDDGKGYVDLGRDNVYAYNDDGDLIGAFDGTWLAVNGQIVAYYMLDETDDGLISGYIPALLNGQRVDIMVTFSNDTQSWTVLGARVVYDGDETDTVARGLVDIQDGDKLDFVASCYDYERNFQDNYLIGQTLTVKGPLKLANKAIDNTGYIASYRITDLYQNHFWTPAI